MGTNYYLHEKAPCECCGREYGSKHIGKSSGGWCFSLHVVPEENIRDLADWELLWSQPGAYIKNERGERISVAKMLDIITNRSWDRAPNRQFDYKGNHAEPGPKGLARHVRGPHCLGHGAGTWDLIPGEFA